MADSTVDGLPTGSFTDASLLIHSLPGQAVAYDANVASLRTFLFDTGTGTDWGDGTVQSLLSVIGDLLARVAELEVVGIWSFDSTTGVTFDSTSTTFDRT
jgi:hypothetical protein